MWHDNNIETWRFLQGKHPPCTQKDQPGLEGCFVVVEKCALPIILLVTCVCVASFLFPKPGLQWHTDGKFRHQMFSKLYDSQRAMGVVTSCSAWHYWALKMHIHRIFICLKLSQDMLVGKMVPKLDRLPPDSELQRVRHRDNITDIKYLHKLR